MTGEYAPEEPEYDPDYEPTPDDEYRPEDDDTRDHRPEPEDRRDPPLTTEEARERALAHIRQIRAEHGLPTKPNIRSGRD